MVTLTILSISFVVLLLAGRLGVRALTDWNAVLRGSLALMFLFTAGSHFGPPRDDLVRMVPPFFPNPQLLVTLTGLAELAGAIGLLVPRLAPWAGTGLALLLVAMFPANVHAAREGLSVAGTPALALVPRTLLQVLYLAATLTAAWAPRLRARARIRSEPIDTAAAQIAAVHRPRAAGG